MIDAHRYHAMPDGRRIAFRLAKGTGPALVFLPGYMSDMAGSKATALFDWAQARGRSCLLLDYSGCGKSEGDFAEGTLSRWRAEAVSLIEAEIAGPVILVGSSMGGWLMLLLAEKLGDRVAALVGIASAPDFTRWSRSETDRIRLQAGETVLDPNPYGDAPTPLHPGFFRDGENNSCLDRQLAIDCPARLIHGQRDSEVPWKISLQVAEALRSDDVQVILVKDAFHRLSREQDIDLLLRTIDSLPGN